MEVAQLKYRAAFFFPKKGGNEIVNFVWGKPEKTTPISTVLAALLPTSMCLETLTVHYTAYQPAIKLLLK